METKFQYLFGSLPSRFMTFIAATQNPFSLGWTRGGSSHPRWAGCGSSPPVGGAALVPGDVYCSIRPPVYTGPDLSSLHVRA